MDKLELRDWLRQPETQWVLEELNRLFPADQWKAADNLKSLGECKGRREVVDFLGRLLEMRDFPAPEAKGY